MPRFPGAPSAQLLTDVAVVSYGSSIVATGIALLAMYILRELGVA